MHQQQRPLQVEDRIRQRHLGRQHLPGVRRVQSRVGGRDDDFDGFRPPRRPGHDATVLALAAHRDSAEKRRRRVVGMSFELRRHRQPVFRGPGGRHRLIDAQARDSGRRTAPEAGRLRNLAADLHTKTRRRRADVLPREKKCRLDAVFARRTRTVELPRDRVRLRRPDLDDPCAQVDLHRHRQRIEPRPEVADRAGDDYFRQPCACSCAFCLHFSVLAGPHIPQCAWGPTPMRWPLALALTAAQGCRSLSRGDYAPRSGRRRLSFARHKKKPADPVGPAGLAVSVVVSATHCAEATGPRHPSNPDAGARANDGPNQSAQHGLNYK